MAIHRNALLHRIGSLLLAVLAAGALRAQTAGSAEDQGYQHLQALMEGGGTVVTLLDYQLLARWGTVEQIQDVFARQKKLYKETFGANGETFLMLALQEDRPAEVVSALLARKCSPAAKAADGRIPAMFAAQYDTHPDVLQLLLGKKGKRLIKAKDASGRTIVDYVQLNQNPEVAAVLAAYGVAVPVPIAVTAPPPVEEEAAPAPEAPAEEETPQDEEGGQEADDEEEVPRISLESFAALQGSMGLRSYAQTYLYDYAADDSQTVPEPEAPAPEIQVEAPDRADENGVTLLMQAARNGNDWDVEKLLESGADIQRRDKDGWSALMYAVRYQNSLPLVRMLVDAGAHVRVRNKFNSTPLLLAAEYTQNPDILALLLQNRSSSEDEVFKAFILTLTTSTGSEYVKQAKVRLFLDMDIPVNRVWNGRTPLMYACQYSTTTAIIASLLASGARTGPRDAAGRTAFDYAKDNVRLRHDDTYWALNAIN